MLHVGRQLGEWPLFAQTESFRPVQEESRSPTHKPEPYSDGGEFGEGEVVGVVLFVARRHRAEMLKFVEEAFDEITEG
jgi:hypothetical protein